MNIYFLIEFSLPTARIKQAIIVIGALGDIVRVMEEIFKPIIHQDEVYYVLDGDVR